MVRTVLGHLVSLPAASIQQFAKYMILDPFFPTGSVSNKKKTDPGRVYLDQAIYLRRQLRESRYQSRLEIERLEQENRLLKRRERQLYRRSIG